tara:strand:+ start:4788 stop:5570 length:783 start_codon:yes stop_codon:yes gene_type:complete
MLWPNGSTVEPRLGGGTDTSETDYGPRKTGKKWHDGVDFGNYFSAICSIDDGVVDRVQEWDGRPAASTRTAHGNRVWIKHANGVESSYSHMSGVLVKKGDKVRRGQRIGTMSNTGQAYGVHLHFEIRVNGVLRDPIPFMRDRVVAGSASGGTGTPFNPEDEMNAAQEQKLDRAMAMVQDVINAIADPNIGLRVAANGARDSATNAAKIASEIRNLIVDPERGVLAAVGHIGSLPDADLSGVATLVADELDRRQRERLGAG